MIDIVHSVFDESKNRRRIIGNQVFQGISYIFIELRKNYFGFLISQRPHINNLYFYNRLEIIYLSNTSNTSNTSKCKRLQIKINVSKLAQINSILFAQLIPVVKTQGLGLFLYHNAYPYINCQMSERKMWTAEEDSMILSLVARNEDRPQSQKWKWSDIANIMQQQIPDCKRSGKQCRERWHNQLDPKILKNKELTPEQIEKLFSLQNRIGNKWAIIANEMPGRTDNNLKNFFYSSLRRALRQINHYVSKYKKKSNIKPFKQTLLTKVLNIGDQKYREKLAIKKNSAYELANNIKLLLARLSLDNQDKVLDEKDLQLRQKLVKLIQDFNKNCKKRKGKKMQQEEPDLQNLQNYNRHKSMESVESVQSKKVKKYSKEENMGKQVNKFCPYEIQRNQGFQRCELEFMKENPQLNQLIMKKGQSIILKKDQISKKGLKSTNKKQSKPISKKQSKSSGRQVGRSSGHTDEFLKNSFTFHDFPSQPNFMLTRRSSIENRGNQLKLSKVQSSTSNIFQGRREFINSLPKMTKNQSNASDIFHYQPELGLNPMMLESLNIGEKLNNPDDKGILGESDIFKFFKQSSRADQANENI